ncbi:terminal uridylyltransferase Tailor-like isoform X2 [Adelges cooleyi]|uniref:terminal uridylyltransferase Tailor-like isoform X2 n=1 Tax=Adelges cooleyi TaxID=133065 RepID=UPI00218044AB|nr:terminal uridylyltransferase Tailor-like isoform X2 [Adelges cooleyi]
MRVIIKTGFTRISTLDIFVRIQLSYISAELKKNECSLLKKVIRKNYGEFKEISNKKNSFIILLHDKEGVHAIMKNSDELEKQYSIRLQTFEQDSENKLSPETIQSFSDWEILLKKMFDLISTMKITSEDPTEKKKLNKLCDTVKNLGVKFHLTNVHVFGSRVYGLAMINSDVDLYLDIGNSFNGQISNDVDRQVSLVKYFAQQCNDRTSEFQNVEQICDARVPILKFYHVPTKLNCDLSFKSGLSTSNTKLIKYYLSINNEVHWLVTCIVKYWALQNGLKHRQLFTSYALVWLVLFYLMSINIVPPLVKLMNMVPKKNRITIEGWDCSFEMLPKPKTTEDTERRFNLLYGFFQYYSDEKKFKSQVLCTFTGKCMKKSKFFSDFIKLSEIKKTQRAKFKTLQSNIYKSFEKRNGLTLQDPFELSFNITKNITGDTLTRFCDMCYETMVLMDNMTAIDKSQ